MMIILSFNFCYATDLLDDVSGMADELIEDVANSKNVTTPIQEVKVAKKPIGTLANLDDKRFIHKHEVLFDTFAGLQWQDSKFNDSYSAKKKFYSAKDYCESLNLDSKRDWRLPTKIELKYAIKNISDKFNNNNKYRYYWTSSIHDKYTYYSYRGSNPEKDNYTKTKYTNYVRCIRGKKYNSQNDLLTVIKNKYAYFFEIAQKINTEEAYIKYITNYSENHNSNISKAKAKIFELTKKANTLEAYERYIAKHAKSNKTYTAEARDRIFEFIQKKNTVEAYSHFVKMYPKATQREIAIKKIFELSKLKVRFTYKEGKIGERYVPTSEYSSSNPDTTTTYINGKSYTSTTYNSSSSTSGGYNSDVYGFKYLYDIINRSEDYYIIEVRADWTGTYKKYTSYRTGAWGGGDKRHKLVDSKKASKYFETFILAPGDVFKDQFEVGEKEPSDLELKLVKVKKLEKNYFEGLVKALSYSSKKGSKK